MWHSLELAQSNGLNAVKNVGAVALLHVADQSVAFRHGL